AEGGLIRAPGEERQGYSGSAGLLGGPLDQLSEPYRQFDPFADLLGAVTGGGGRLAQLLYAGEERFHVLAQKLLPECRVGSRAGEFVFGDRRISAHGRRLVNNAPWRCIIWRQEIIKSRLSFCYLGPTPLRRPGSLDRAWIGVSFAPFTGAAGSSRDIWRLRSFFRARAARRSAWARGWRKPLRRRAGCSRKSMRRSANG